jgi:predicted  nucleic acid-binding Zn-ribbon protein
LSKTVDEKLDMLLDAVAGLTQTVTSIDQRLTNVENRLVKVEVNQEKMQGDIKTLAEGIVTTRGSLERKIDEAVEKINNRDDIQDKAIYKLTKVQ